MANASSQSALFSSLLFLRFGFSSSPSDSASNAPPRLGSCAKISAMSMAFPAKILARNASATCKSNRSPPVWPCGIPVAAVAGGGGGDVNCALAGVKLE